MSSLLADIPSPGSNSLSIGPIDLNANVETDATPSGFAWWTSRRSGSATGARTRTAG